MDNKIRVPPIELRWLLCPFCGAKTVLFDNTADCHGVHIKCTRGCKQVFEIKIVNGEQVHS